jgi:ribonuclease HI
MSNPDKDKNKDNLWKRMSFKGNKVWAHVDSKNNLVENNEKVLIKYNLEQNYEYKVKSNSLKPEDQAVPAQKIKTRKTTKGSSKKSNLEQNSKNVVQEVSIETDLPDNCIKIYTDGASSGNPGPSGIGVLLIYGENKKEISQYIGKATNNIAELTAIKVALEELKRKDLPVCIFSDSSYSIGLLTKGWKPKKNKELVLEIRTLMKKFNNLTFIKVKGHAGIKENEVADFLATSAIKKGSD